MHCPSQPPTCAHAHTHTHTHPLRLLDFSVVDGAGEAVPLERSLLLAEPVFLAGEGVGA